MVVVLVHRSVQRVLDGNDGRIGLFPVKRLEDVFKPLAGEHLDRRAKQFSCGFLTERPALALESHHLARAPRHALHSWATAPSQRRAFSLGRPSRSSTRSTL